MRSLLPIPLFLALALPAIAGSRTVSIQEMDIASGRLAVPVPPGDGLTLDFSGVGQMVQGVAFGDPTQIVVSGVDGQFCSGSDRCQSSGASVLLLRQVRGIVLPAQTHSADRGTTLTLVTEGKLGRKILHLRVIPAARASYTALVVAPNSKPLPLPTPLNPLPQISVASTLLPSPPPSQPIPSPETSELKSPETKAAEDSASSVHPVTTASTPNPPEAKKLPKRPKHSGSDQRLSQGKPLKAQSKKSDRQAPESPPTVIAAIPSPKPEAPNSLQSSPAPSPTLQAVIATPVAVKPATTPPPAAQPSATSPIPPLQVTAFRGYSKQYMQRVADANALNRGIHRAIANKQLAHGSYQYYQAQTAIALLRDGRSRQSAARHSGLPLDLLNTWINLGRL